MTLKELSQLHHLKREIRAEQDRLRELEDAATDISAKVSGMACPDGPSDKTAIAVQIADCRTLIRAKTEEMVVEYNRLVRYINTIDDSLTRQIFRFRFLDDFSWMKVAAAVGGNNTEDSVKKICYRFLRNS